MTKGQDGLFHSHCGPVSLDYERSQTTDRESDEMFNDYGFVIRARADTGEDLHLWMFTYRQSGSEVIIAGDVTQTLLVYGKFSEAEKKQMHDTPYINKGQNIDDYLPPGSIKIEEDENKKQVTWTNAGRIMIGRPPVWEVKGEHAGVKVNLTVNQRGDAFHHCGRFEDLGKVGSAGYIMHARVTGTVEVDGKVLNISRGHGIHERILHTGIVPERIDYMLGRGLNWLHGWGEEFTWYVMAGDIGRMSTAMINIDGEELSTVNGADNAWIEEVGHWLDPKTNQMNPCKWHVWAVTPKGRLDATVSAYGRAFYAWTRRHGIMLVHQSVADGEATFTRNDGTVLKSSNQVCSMEQMRTLYRQAER